MSKLIHTQEHPEPGVVALLEGSGYQEGEIDLSIHRGDEMYHYALDERHGSRGVALMAYFQSGLSAFRSLQGILEGVFGEDTESLKILDFASGYGRLTRFLIHHVGRERVTIAEIDPDAVAFQVEQFGVRGIVSSTDPTELPLDPEMRPEEDRFDVIFVASLFSHLPRHSFEGWLRRLEGLLTPRGVLIFTVHDESAMLPGRTMPEEGFYFEALSESEFLELAEYGSTWVTEGFLRALLAPRPYQRIPRGLWHLQDIYVASGRQERSLKGELPGRGVQGYVDTCSLKRDGDLLLGGWAVHHDPGKRVDEIVVSVAGEERARRIPELERSDVSAFLGEEFGNCAWQVLVEQGDRPFAAGDLVRVTAHSGPEVSVLFSASLEATLLYTNLDRDRHTLHQLRDLAERQRLELDSTRAEADGLRGRAEELEGRVEALGYDKHLLEERIAAMEASRFWKLRNAWFRLKGAR